MKPSNIAVLAAALLLSGCELFPDRSQVYVSARQEKPLSTAGVFDRSRLKDDWVVPEGERKAWSEDKFELPAPPRALEDITAIKAAYRELNGQQWLSVSESPSQAWSAISQYWASNGLRIERAQADQGIMDVKYGGNSARALAWQEQLGVGTLPASWRVQVQAGLKRTSSEVRLSGLSPEQARAMLSALQAWLTERSEETYSLRARQLDGEARVKLVTLEEGGEQLEMRIDYDRGWFEVSEALRQAGIPVTDRDRSQGTFDVAIKERTIFERWWHRLKGYGDQAPADTRLRLIKGRDRLILVAEPLISGEAGKARARRALESVLEHMS
ncbi:MAG: outer membrane protein assembly factor BamC [Gammaproteobacteria bacterium]|nr:MAG: outer membrane protein assembly factor BamC [Gammaproteobacteria bacterium]